MRNFSNKEDVEKYVSNFVGKKYTYRYSEVTGMYSCEVECVEELKGLIGKRVLCTVGDDDSIQSVIVIDISPNELYVNLSNSYSRDYYIGWVKVSDVSILDVLSGK